MAECMNKILKTYKNHTIHDSQKDDSYYIDVSMHSSHNQKDNCPRRKKCRRRK